MRAYYDPDGSAALGATPVAELSSPDSVFSFMLRATRSLILLSTLLFVAARTSGCVYRPISQGNIVEEEDLDQVKLGMTRNQVRFPARHADGRRSVSRGSLGLRVLHQDRPQAGEWQALGFDRLRG